MYTWPIADHAGAVDARSNNSAGEISLVNLVALLVADLIWRRYVYSILDSCKLLMGKTNKLDFTADPEINDLSVMEYGSPFWDVV